MFEASHSSEILYTSSPLYDVSSKKTAILTVTLTRISNMAFSSQQFLHYIPSCKFKAELSQRNQNSTTNLRKVT
jgi:hypothetical protein